MSKRTTGERVADEMIFYIERHKIAVMVDAIVRQEKAKAWDECYVRIRGSDPVLCANLKVPRDANPYD